MKAAPAFRVQPVSQAHDRRSFSCGVEPLDQYLRTQAGQDMRKGVAAVFVLCNEAGLIGGYYTLSSHAVKLGSLPAETAKRLPRYPVVPATCRDDWLST